MSYIYKNLNITKIAVIGAGQIGPDIALHFAKSLSSFGVQVVVVDISEDALQKASAKTHKKVQKGIESGAFKPDQAITIISSLQFSSDYDLVRGAQMVVEAATEDENIKDKIFLQLEKITSEECIFLSNSSHMQPEVIFRNIQRKSRTMVAHYFFPAEINPVVELVPGAETDAALIKTLLGFYESTGKVPIQVKSSYGYALDPIFEGLCLTAMLCLQNGYGNEKEIDAAAVKALGLGVGPFTALNLTGGNPITAHGLDEMGKRLMPWFHTPENLRLKNNTKEAWNTAQKGEIVTLNTEKESFLQKEFQGAYFALTSFILDTGIIEINDLNMSCELALAMTPPFKMMNSVGIEKAFKLTQEFCARHQEFPFPKSLLSAKDAGGWKLRDITTDIRNNVLVITIRRPKVLNALNQQVLNAIMESMEQEKNNSELKGVVITGFGTKAFVSGADINMLASLKTPEEGVNNSRMFQSVLNYIENYSKPVVCAMNGFAFGGGNELAMACTTRICKKGIPVLACQPEVNLGFIPGAGGTQRLPRLVGVEKAAEILRTGRNVSAKEAEEIGLVHAQIEGDLLEAAINLVKKIARGEIKVKTISKVPLENNSTPSDVELGHHSKKIDSILVTAIYQGSLMSLQDGLELESKMFGECLNTKDMKIGLENFKINGPKVKAKFVDG